MTEALGITQRAYRLALDAPPIALLRADRQVSRWSTGVRIGITKAVELPWRYGLKDSKFLSKPFPAGRYVFNGRPGRVRGSPRRTGSIVPGDSMEARLATLCSRSSASWNLALRATAASRFFVLLLDDLLRRVGDEFLVGELGVGRA